MDGKFGICLVSSIPGRAEPSDKSEMVTQLLFGETYSIIDDTTKKNWIQIKCSYDNYECWIDRGLNAEITAEEFAHWNEKAMGVTESLTTEIQNIKSDFNFPIVRGSSFIEGDKKFEIGSDEYFVSPQTGKRNEKSVPDKLVAFAKEYLNTPYLWGGRSPFGLDCSGFTQVVYKYLGIKLPRDAYQQAEIGTTVEFVSEAKTGDLAFFENSEGRIIHVGIVLDEGLIIHASSRVKIGKLDHEGIFDLKYQRYTHKLRIVKRIF